MTAPLSPGPLLAHVCSDAPALRVPRGRAIVWPDQHVHEAGYAADPEVYAMSALVEGATTTQRVRVLTQILRASRRGLGAEPRRTIERVTAVLLAALPADDVITVLLALRRMRANHKHVRAAVLWFVFDHPESARLARARRAALVDVLEHALGRDVARGAARRAGETGAADDAYLRANILRFVRDPARAVKTLRRLYADGAPASIGPGAAPVSARRAAALAELLDPKLDAPKTVTATNRGDIAATLVHIYRGGASAELSAAAAEYADRAAESLPRLPGRVTLVLDASASTAGYGERAFSCISQAVALKMVLERVCADLRVVQVGGRGEPPVPEGASDLATAVLDALEDDAPARRGGGPYRAGRGTDRGPDVIAVVTDGYENRFGGDLRRVLASLPGQGAAPVVVCSCKFTAKDDLSLRRIGRADAEIEFWHEDDFRRVVLALGAHARPRTSVPFVRAALADRLDRIEQELSSWTAA